jgi:ATP/maltotriose-dependent transcriptional regulator MalT
MLLLGESTIKSHVRHLLTKLDIPNRVHAVIYAYQHGLVTERQRSLVAGFGSEASAVA